MKKIFLLMALISLAVFYSCQPEPIDPIETDYVLLGGVKWAKTNLCKPKTFAKSNEEIPAYFQFNRKMGWYVDGETVINFEGDTVWNNEPYISGDWEKINDPCPDGWRVPTMDELEKLTNIYTYWGELDGVNGRFYLQEDQEIFLPALGYLLNLDGSIQEVSRYGYYWSSNSYGDENAHKLDLGINHIGMHYDRKNFGFPIRCVKED